MSGARAGGRRREGLRGKDGETGFCPCWGEGAGLPFPNWRRQCLQPSGESGAAAVIVTRMVTDRVQLGCIVIMIIASAEAQAAIAQL